MRGIQCDFVFSRPVLVPIYFKIDSKKAADFVNCLWEYPLAFQRMVVYKYREAIIDILAGRIYGEIGDCNPARIAMRKLLAPKNEVNQQGTAESLFRSAA